MNKSDFYKIEDYSSAYKGRYSEFKQIETKVENSSILEMHLGGIIIECLLKSKIVKIHNLKYKNRKKWFDETMYKNIFEQDQNARHSFIKSIGIENKEHKIEALARCIPELNGIIETDQYLKCDLELLYNPLGSEKFNFIDLRYVSNEYDDNIEHRYILWKNSFKRVIQRVSNL